MTRASLLVVALAACQVDSQVGSNRIALGDAAAPPDAQPLPACRDGEDNDGDDLIDHPFDPGCDDLSDLDERDPAVPPVCANRGDDDGDDVIDFPLEPGCTSAPTATRATRCRPPSAPTASTTTTAARWTTRTIRAATAPATSASPPSPADTHMSTLSFA
jgi:hypothetical protein